MCAFAFVLVLDPAAVCVSCVLALGRASVSLYVRFCVCKCSLKSLCVYLFYACVCVFSYVVVGLTVRFCVRKPACGRAGRGGFAGIGAALPAKKVVQRNLRDK